MNGSNSNTSGANVATVDFTKKGLSDQVPDALFAEIARRIQVTFEGTQQSDIASSVTPPADKTLIWWPKDPTSGTRIGQPQVYDATQNIWVPLGGDGTVPTVVLPQVIVGNAAAAAGGSVVPITFTPFKSQTTNYSLSLSPTTGDGTTFGSAPTTMTAFGWIITNKANNQFTIQFYAVPSGGINFDWRLEEIL